MRFCQNSTIKYFQIIQAHLTILFLLIKVTTLYPIYHYNIANSNPYDILYIHVPELTSTSYPHNDSERLTRVTNLLGSAERYLAFSEYLRSTVYDQRTGKADLNILAIQSISRGADTPSPLEAADWFHKEAITQINRAKEILRLVKPRVSIVSKTSPSGRYWSS